MEYLLNEDWIEGWKERNSDLVRLPLKIVWVSPEEALKFFAHPFEVGVPVETTGIRETSVKMITEGLKKGVKLPPLLHFPVPGGYKTAGGKTYFMVNEGRNRAFVSWELGIKKIPVLVQGWGEKSVGNSQWDAVIRKVMEVSGGVKRLYQPIDHPYFKDWEVTQVCSDRLETILKFTGDVKGQKVLDIGCFFGYFSHRLAALGAEVVGLDISPRKIELCNLLSECYDLTPTNPAFHHISYQKYLESDGQYDFTLFLSQFHHDLRENMESAWEGVNLISKQTDLMFLDMNEGLAERLFHEKGVKWSPELILRHTEFTECFPLKASHRHGRILYAFKK